MASADFNNVVLRNVAPANADGSFVPPDYVFTVGPDAKQRWTNDLKLNNVVVSSIFVNSTLSLVAGNFITLYVSTGTFSTLSTSFISTTSTITTSTIGATNITYSTLTGLINTTSFLTASTANATNLGFSTATGHLLTANSLVVNSSLTTSTLNGVHLNYLTLQGSTLSTGNAFASAIGFSTAAGNVLTANITNATSANVNNGFFSTLTGSSLTTSTLSVSSLYYSTLIGSTIQTSTLMASSLGFSTMTGSTLTTAILNATIANVNSGVYSTLTGSSIATSTLFASTLRFSTIEGSTLIAAAVVVQSTFVGSTVNAVNIGFSTLTGNALIINTTVSNSTLTGSTMNAVNIGFSTLVGSTLTYNTAVSNSTLTGSTINAINIGFSTLQGSSITTNTMLMSTLAASSIQVTSLSYSTMRGSTITASTVNVVGLLTSANVGVGMTNPTYTLQASTLNTVNLSGNYIQDWTTVFTNSDATAFTPTFNGTQTGPSGSPLAMNVVLGGLITDPVNTVLTYTGNVISGNVYQLTFIAKMTGTSPTFTLCDHIANDTLIAGTTQQTLSNVYTPYTLLFTAPSGSFSLSCRSQGTTTFSYYGVQLRAFVNQMIGGLGVGTTNPQYSLHVPKGSIQAYNYQQFEWINTQSNNRLGYNPANPVLTAGLFKVATMGVTSASGTYGMLNVRGQIGGFSNSNTMYVDLVIMTRGGLTVWGTVYGNQSSAALQCDVVYNLNPSSQYDIYIYIKSSATPYIVYDLVVSGASGSNILYDPAATAMMLMPNPPLTLVSISALASIYSNGGNVGLGKAADPAYRLDVNGIINATQFYQNGSPFISGGGGGGGGTGYTGPAGAGGPVAILSAVPSTTQTVSANTLSLVRWGSIDTTQSTGETGLAYTSTLGPMNGTFINNTANTLPVLVQYSLVLNLTGSGYSYVGVTSATSIFTSYGITYNDTNGFANSYTVLLTPGASVGVYYTDNVATDVQPTSRISLTILTAGAQGPTGPTGQVTKWSVKPSVVAQSIPSNVLTLVTWGSTIVSQTVGITGLAYTEEGLFTNNTSATIPLLVDYSMFVSYTGGGYTAIGINGSTTVYGARFNDNVAITNSFTVLLSPGSTIGIYYLDNAATTLLNTSHLSLTILTAGPQGPTGPSGQVTTLSVTPTASLQTIPASVTLSLVIWGSTDTTQSTGSTGLLYNAGVFTNTLSTALLLLVEYTLNLDTTLSGYSAIGINGSSNVYGGIYNDSNIVGNSFVVLLPSGSSLGIYYMDNTSVVVQQTSRLSLTVLTVGPQGPTGSSQWSLVGNALSYPGNISATGTVNSITVGRGPGGVASNTVVGANALANNTTGGNNMVVGYNAGYTPAGFTGSNNIYLGASAAPSSGAANNEIVIGQGATGAGSNTAVIGNPATVSTTLFGSVRSFNYTVVVSSTGYTTIIANDLTGNPLYRNSGIWLVSANATTTVGNITLSATAYAATNITSSNATNVFGGFSASSYVAITGGTNTGAFLGYGVYLNVTNVAAYGTYNVNFLRIN
jgi:hypothetical protein